jgi:ubiquinone/menaquinone biosynthesis C-methylase UbiE
MTQLQQQLKHQRDQQSHIWGHLQKERLDAIRQYAGDSVMDVGCANGVYVQAMREYGYAVWGLDLLRFADWNTLEGHILMADAIHLPLVDNGVDTIISFETLEHVPNYSQALHEYHRVCRKNIIVSVPNCQTPEALSKSGFTYHHWIDRTHVNFFSLETFIQAVEEAGFAVRYAAKVNEVFAGMPLLYALGMPLLWSYRIARVINRVTPRKFPMTLLVAAEKC